MTLKDEGDFKEQGAHLDFSGANVESDTGEHSRLFQLCIQGKVFQQLAQSPHLHLWGLTWTSAVPGKAAGPAQELLSPALAGSSLPVAALTSE